MPDYLITTRKLRRGAFAAEPGPTRFLKIAADESPNPNQAIKRKPWLDEVLSLAHTHQDPRTDEDCGDIVVFVHGYNTTPVESIERHRAFHSGLANAGFNAAFVSFDWPSDDRAIDLLSRTATGLFRNCALLLQMCRPDPWQQTIRARDPCIATVFA